MICEEEYIYETTVETAFLNEYKIMKPYAYQELFAKVVDMHLTAFNCNVDNTLKYNLAWALISLSIEIITPINSCMKLYASTWHSEKKGPLFRREYVFKNESGEVMFKGSSFSVLLNVENRTIYRKKEYPFPIGLPNDKKTIEATHSTKLNGINFEVISDRVVYNSYIDCLGHVNNCRYSEFAYDSLTDEETAKLDKLKRMDVYFLSELRNKDTFSILKAYDDDKIFVRGHNKTKDDTSFDIILTF